MRKAHRRTLSAVMPGPSSIRVDDFDILDALIDPVHKLRMHVKSIRYGLEFLRNAMVNNVDEIKNASLFARIFFSMGRFLFCCQSLLF